MDGNRVHTSIVIELGNQEDTEYQKAYQLEFGDLDIPRDYVIDQIFCGENITVYAVFEVSEDGRKPEKQLEESDFDVHGDYRIYHEKPSRRLLSEEDFCKFINEVRSKEDIKYPLTENHMFYRFPREENPGDEVKAIDSKVMLLPEKISLGTNTSLAKFTPLFFDKEVQETGDSKAKSIEAEYETNRKSEDLKAQPKEKNKNAILKEIKKLQKKINSLIRTIESSDFDFDAEELEFSGADSLNYEKPQRNLETGVALKERQNNKKYDQIPIFSSLNYPTNPKKTMPKQKRVKGQERREIPLALTRSVSLLSVGSSTTQIISSGTKPEALLRKVSSDCSIKWRELEDWRGPGLSKSEMINHVILMEPKYNLIKGVKKSLSLELRDDKLEVICLKKFQNFPCKLDGSLRGKGNLRIVPKRQSSFRDRLPLPNCEMGDEAGKKTKTSKGDLMGLVQVCDKKNGLSFEKINLTPNKNLNEEEGDAKLVYPKQNLAPSRFPRNATELEVHFCSATNNTGTDGLPKAEKTLHTSKLKFKPAESNADPGLKVCSDSEKPTTPNKNCRKDRKKEIASLRKSNKKTPRDRSEKNDVQEPVRPRSVTGSRRNSARGHHETNRTKTDTASGQKTSHLAKRCSEEKAANKIDRLPRPISQKREPTEAPNDCVEGKETKNQKKNSLTVNVSHKKSATGLTSGVGPADEQGKDNKKGQTSDEPPSVMVELFSERPQLGHVILGGDGKKRSKPKQNAAAEAAVVESNAQPVNGEDSDEFKKPIVKSLWALTKLILFEDGTQKLEILEASLNPPEWV